jgi:succinyl-diaminopimelate desuccinylase
MKLSEIELSQALIRIPSYSGYNKEVLDYLGNFLEKLGFECNYIDFDGDDSYKVNNLQAEFNPNKSDEILYFAGHTDIVNEGNKADWKYDPFAAEIHDGKLFGRGAVDMKCAIACFMSAVQDFLENNPSPNFGIGFLITNDEEADSVNGTKKLLKWMEENGKKITHCLVGEPTNPNEFGEMIKIGRRGSVGFHLKIIGKQGHVAYPQNALNPNTILINSLKTLKDHKFDNGNEHFDPTNLEITNISSQNLGGNVIPNYSEASFNIRFNNIHDGNSIVEFVDYVCSKTIGGNLNPEISGSYELTHKISGDSFLNKPGKFSDLIVRAVKKTTGKTPELSTTGGTSDARFIKNYATCVEIGLVNKTAHRTDEFSLITEINLLKDTYLEILKNF